MRCVLRPTRIVWQALPIVLIVTAAPSVAIAQPVCHAIRRGESATQVARRLTGESWNAYQTWFEIRNAGSRPIPKSQYNSIRAGWKACFPKRVVKPIPAIPSPVVAASRDPDEAVAPSPTPDAPEAPALLANAEPIAAVRDVDFSVWWLAPMMLVSWLGWRMLDGYLTRRKTTSIVVGYFAHRFIVEFERPLLRDDAEPALRSRFRRGTRLARFDILLAPGKGRRYPNLSDHKQNVEYDVARVMQSLADDAFVSGPLYTQAGWVVVPFRFTADRPRRRAFGAPARHEQHTGVTCISSF